MAGVDQHGATNVHVLPSVASEDSAVPRVLPEVSVALLEAGGLDAAQVANRVTLPAAGADGALLAEVWAPAAHASEATGSGQRPDLQGGGA